MPELTIVVPCYNEETVIAKTLSNIMDALAGRSLEAEVLVVDDCSTDNTAGVVAAYQNAHPDAMVKLHRNPVNRGSGYSYAAGAAFGTGRWCILVPGDNDLPADALSAIFNRLGSAEILLPYPRLEDFRERPLLRRVVSRAYNALICFAGGIRVRYVHSPPVYPREFIVSSKISPSGFGYFAELLCLAVRTGLTVAEFPVPALYGQQEGTSAFRLANLRSVAASIARIFMRRVLPRSHG